MRSSSRNSREHSSVLALAAAASLLLGSAAQAGEHTFVLTAYSNGRGGPALSAGDYEAASKASGYKPLSAFDISTNSNNRCVSLTMMKQWDAARAACDQAVRDAEHEKVSMSAYQIWTRHREDDSVAVALSNRAVLHWAAAESAAAAADLKRAAQLSPKSAFIQRNQSALEYSHPGELAKLDVASK